METIQLVCKMIQPQDYLTSIDLQDAFLHVLIHSASRKYLQFQWKNNTFQFKTLAFGLSLSPMVFTKILKPLLRWARRKGIRISAYLDDLIIAAKSKELSHLHTSQVCQKLKELGFLFKESKSHLQPTQQINHLGFTIDTRNMSLSVPTSKRRDIRREALKMLRQKTCTLRQLSSFIGKAQATTPAVFPARLQTRDLLQLKNHHLQSGALWNATVQLTPSACANLHWWINHLTKWNGLSFLPETPTQEIFTDASDQGWGIIFNNHVMKGTWTQEELNQHINYRELAVIWKCVNLRALQGQVLRIYCDNTSAIAYIRHFGGTRSPALMELASSIWNVCLKTNTRLHLTYIPSAINPADSPSRQMTTQIEWRIDQQYFRHLEQLWGTHDIDCFASYQNHQTQRYFSWKWDPKALSTNAFLTRWNRWKRVFICPPWNLLPRCLQHINQYPTAATIITPNWPSAIWYPVLLSMTQQPPIRVPPSMIHPSLHGDDLLQKNQSWELLAWNVNDNA